MMTSILAPNWASRIVVENRPQVHVMTENLRRSAPNCPYRAVSRVHYGVFRVAPIVFVQGQFDIPNSALWGPQ